MPLFRYRVRIGHERDVHIRMPERIADRHDVHALAAGEQIDVGSLTQALNSLLGLFRLLGLERRQKPLRRLHEHMNGTMSA